MKYTYILWQYDDYTEQRSFLKTCATLEEAEFWCRRFKDEDYNYIYEIEKVEIHD